MIFSVKNNCSGITIFSAVWEGQIFMETGVPNEMGFFLRGLKLKGGFP